MEIEPGLYWAKLKEEGWTRCEYKDGVFWRWDTRESIKTEDIIVVTKVSSHPVKSN